MMAWFKTSNKCYARNIIIRYYFASVQHIASAGTGLVMQKFNHFSLILKSNDAKVNLNQSYLIHKL